MIDILTAICSKIWKTGEWPTTWTQSLVITLPKKGNLQLCQNYRTIILISHPSKVMLKIILNRLQPQAEEIIAEEQAGFTTYLGKSCSFCLPRVPFVNCRQFMYLVISLLVLRAGYGIWLYQFLIIAYLFTFQSRKENDRTNIQSQNPLREIPAASAESLPCLHRLQEGLWRVWHEVLWATLRKYNINASIIRAIENPQSAVLFNGSTGEWFRTTVGVRQGCLLSPTLFNIFLERIIGGALDDQEGSVRIGGRLITNFCFADDIVVNAEEEEERGAMVDRLDRTTTKYKMEIGPDKTKVMTNNPNGFQREIKI